MEQEVQNRDDIEQAFNKTCDCLLILALTHKWLEEWKKKTMKKENGKSFTAIKIIRKPIDYRVTKSSLTFLLLSIFCSTFQFTYFRMKFLRDSPYKLSGSVLICSATAFSFLEIAPLKIFSLFKSVAKNM